MEMLTSYFLLFWLQRWRPIRKRQNGQSGTVALEIANYACLSVRTKEVMLQSDCTSAKQHKHAQMTPCSLPSNPNFGGVWDLDCICASRRGRLIITPKQSPPQRQKNRDFVFIREQLSHQLWSQGQHSCMYIHTCTHTQKASIWLFFSKIFLLYLSPLNEAVNLEMWGSLQCSPERCYNDPGTELVN